jgi:dextranase
MRLVDFYPSHGSFLPGEPVTFLIDIETAVAQEGNARIHIQHLAEEPIILEHPLDLKGGTHPIQIDWLPPAEPAGYSARLEIYSSGRTLPVQAFTAFDVLSNWTDFPRYGFLTDFSGSRADPENTVKELARFHINGLQFYDWQYRHDQLLPPTDEYIDPLGRAMSLVSVRRLVEAAHRHGMAALPYLAVYAASVDFWRAHPDWALYDEAGDPIPFGDNFLGLMNPSFGSPWSHHLLAEGARALRTIPFDGLHIDQYGDPKRAWDARHDPVDLPRAFADFVQAASDQHPGRTILFNAVGNWPIDALSESAVGFVYVEVWPPDLAYRRLAEIVLNAVRLSHGKAVVIALYIPADRPGNNLLADAVILACGGTRIELGEEARLLADPYFPKHEGISPDLRAGLRRLADFAVRNGEWLRPYALPTKDKEAWSEGELDPAFITTGDPLMIVARRYPGSLVVQLVNFTGLNSHQRWDESHSAPAPCKDVLIRIQMPQRPARIFWDCPEEARGSQILSFEYSDGILTTRIPQINLMGLVAIYE